MTSDSSRSPDSQPRSVIAGPWHYGVTSYQWLILLIASAGWVFDTYEGRIFNITRVQLLQSLLPAAGMRDVARWGDIFLGIFVFGAALGGVLFGAMADRWGRKPTLALTILVYSVFSGLTYFAQSLWQAGTLHFLVGMGTGGEWAVAASLVAKVFPAAARPLAAGLFHSTSVFGTWLATLAAIITRTQWRYAYLLGLLPALLALWVISRVEEPRKWKESNAKLPEAPKQRSGNVLELLSDRRWRARAFWGMLLAAAGLGSYWTVHVEGQDLARYILVKNGIVRAVAAEKAKSAYGLFEMAGGLAGMLCFGPLCARVGRKRAFVLSQVAAFLIVPATCYLPRSYGQLLCVLPVFGFLTLAMHSGYAIYFPELFPTRLRAAGAGFCFNAGQVLAAPMFIFSEYLRTQINLRLAMSFFGGLFLIGAVVVCFLPETKGQELPE